MLVVQALTSKQFNNYEIGYTGTIIKDVKIASAGEGYTGELLVTIIGANLKGQSITCSDSSFDNLTYQSNTVATATIDCDGVVGEKSISFYCGSSVVTQTAKVLSSSNCITSSHLFQQTNPPLIFLMINIFHELFYNRHTRKFVVFSATPAPNRKQVCQ